MSAADQLRQGKQFHEMTQQEFERQPSTQFHGTVHGMIAPHGGTFHVGTKYAAEEILKGHLSRRINADFNFPPGEEMLYRRGRTADYLAHAKKYPGLIAPIGNNDNMSPDFDSTHRVYTSDPKVIGGQLNGPVHPRIVEDDDANEQADYLDPHGPILPYENESEDRGSTSFVVPHRSRFKTHEDYLVDARAQGKTIPKRAMRGYTQIPGQGKLF